MKIDHPNLTLDFLQKMTREEAMVYFRRGDKINTSQLITSVIMAASRVSWSDTRGVREFWYNPIKPILYNIIGRHNTDTGRKYDLFNGILSNMVKEGIIAYKDLGIVDFTTLRELHEYEIRGNCWSDVILFVEKDAAYHHLKPLKDLLNITILSGSGVSKTACTESMVDNLNARLDFKIFTVTDYDPSGFFIGKEAADKFKILGLSVEAVHRIAISPDQIDGGILDSQMYPVKMVHDAYEWCDEYGIGPDKQYGVEIEAISGQPGGGQQLRMIVLGALLEHMDEHDRIFELTEDEWSEAPRGVLEYHVDEDTLQWYDEYKSFPIPLSEYLTEDDYTSMTEEREESLTHDTAEWKEELESADNRIEELTDERDQEIAQNYTKFNHEINALDQIHLQPLREELKRLEAEHIDPLREERDSIEDSIRTIYREVLIDPQCEKESLEDRIEEREGQHDMQINWLDENYHKSRAIFAHVIFEWLEYNMDDYSEKGKTDSDFSMGLIEGCLMEACERGDKLVDLRNIVSAWDKDTPYSWIIFYMEKYHMDDIETNIQEMVEKCKEMKEE